MRGNSACAFYCLACRRGWRLSRPAKRGSLMKRSLVHLLAAVLVASAVALVAGAAPAQALDSCSALTPCLPLDDGFSSLLPAQEQARFRGSVNDSGVLWGVNAGGPGTIPAPRTAGVLGEYRGTFRGSGVVGQTNTTAPDAAGVYGLLTGLGRPSIGPGARSAGVRGEAAILGRAGIGVLGLQWGSGLGVAGHTPSGTGVAGYAPSGTGVAGVSNEIGVIGVSGEIGVIGVSGEIGVLGEAPPPGLAGLFLGNLRVQGTLSKSAGAFRIDHPLDPARKYLQHSFVESPDMKNVYDGVVRTDRRGFATVRLPAYFQALNRSFRYQLTIVGRSFAQAIVWKEIAANRFTIKTNQPRVKVSWQVTGIRKDRYANAHRIPVELDKTAAPEQPAALRSLTKQLGP
jgi:hypothetical protein